MKKLSVLTLAALLLLTMLAGCTGGNSAATPTPDTEPVELVVFAAASMTETMKQIAEMYRETAPDVTLVYTFDSSGTLKTQIQEGADCDLFISAAQKQMNQLDASRDADRGNPEGLDFVLQGTRVDLVENKVTLAVPEGNPAGVSSFIDVGTDAVTMVALGNADVPVGQYAEELFVNLGIWDSIQSKISFGSNVKEVTTWVSETVVDCGVVYGTDAYSAGLEVVDIATPDMLSTQVLYPAAVLNITKNEQAARDFLAYLQSDACAAVFQEVGFSIPVS